MGKITTYHVSSSEECGCCLARCFLCNEVSSGDNLLLTIYSAECAPCDGLIPFELGLEYDPDGSFPDEGVLRWQTGDSDCPGDLGSGANQHSFDFVCDTDRFVLLVTCAALNFDHTSFSCDPFEVLFEDLHIPGCCDGALDPVISVKVSRAA